MSGYFEFARFYDILTSNIPYNERAAYFDALIKRHSGKIGGILLDLACGTGSMSIELEKLGYDVIGVDSSPNMLTVAASKKSEDSNIMYLCQDMRELDLFGGVDITICALDGFNHIVDEDDLLGTFKRINMFTNPNGLLIFDVNTIHKHRNILGNNTFVQDYDEVYCVWNNSFNEENCSVEINLDIFEFADGSYYRHEENFKERAYSEELLDRMLKDAGFRLESKYDLDSFDSAHESSEKIVYVARKES